MSEMMSGAPACGPVRAETGDPYRWHCTTCGVRLQSRHEVRRHWESQNVGHSLYRKVSTGRIYHQTIEGLYQRALSQVAEEPPDKGEDAEMAASWAFEIGDRVIVTITHASAGSGVPGEVIARGILEGRRTYLVFTSRVRSPLHLIAEALLQAVDRPADATIDDHPQFAAAAKHH